MTRARETMIIPGRRGDRRRTPRGRPPAGLIAQFDLGPRVLAANIRDVSLAGLGLSLPPEYGYQPEPGEVLQFRFMPAPAGLCRAARVAWSTTDDRGVRFGVEFVGLPAGAECIGLLNLDKLKIDPSVALRLPAAVALRRQVVPFAEADGAVHVACLEPDDPVARQILERTFGLPVKPEPAEPGSLRRALDRVYADLPAALPTGKPRSVDLPNGSKSRSVDQRPGAEWQAEDVVPLCDELMHAAILRQASDMHIDPEADAVVVRFRVDGVLEPYRRLPTACLNGIISRFKVLGGMDIAEKRAPQDGGFKHKLVRSGQTIDIRLATLPTRHGERLTVRLLALQTEALTLEQLGMSAHSLRLFEEAIARPHGLILLTGATGCGKSTTLYAAVRRLIATENLNIITVEDPVEYEMKGVAQVEVDGTDKVTFLRALRSVLRHDPDVVMVGEIRDAETADVAIKASLTGHLVLSTLHTNSAVSVITRLADMGLDHFLIAATLRLAAAQRLVRRLCPHCRRPRPLGSGEAGLLGRPDAVGQVVYDPAGCVYCGGRGYAGRVGLFELLPIDETWSRLIAAGVAEAELAETMRAGRIPTLLDDGAEKCFAGLTSVSEVLSAVTQW